LVLGEVQTIDQVVWHVRVVGVDFTVVFF